MDTHELLFYPQATSFKAEMSQMSDFPHCPNPSCPYYHCPPAGDTWFSRHGSYTTKVVGKVIRYRCNHCRVTFGYRTFHVDYYTKKSISYAQLMAHLVCTTGEGNICRFHGLREDLVLNRYERLSRLLLYLHTLVRKELLDSFPEATLVLDGFESFSHSQYHPNNINILAGKDYEFIYGLGLSVLKRKGRMTRKQKLKRNALEKANKTDSKQTLMSVRNLLQGFMIAVDGEAGDRRVLITDDHKTYPRSLDLIDPLRKFFSHISISSKLYRNFQNLLFVMNYLDRQIRKDSANHVRETIQFAQCPQAMMSRLTIYQVYHNCISPWRVKAWRQGDKRSRAQMMGMSGVRLQNLLQTVWGRRPFRGKSDLWEEEEKTWDMKWENPGRPIGRYKPKYIRA